MVGLRLVLQSASLALSVAKYTGIIQDQLKLPIQQIAGSELEAGRRAFEQAAHSDQEQQSLLREARSRFNKAISLEKDFRLAAAYLGLALCHANLGDATNAERAIQDLTKVKSPEPTAIARPGRAVTKNLWLLSFVKVPVPVPLVMLAIPTLLHDAAVARLVEI